MLRLDAAKQCGQCGVVGGHVGGGGKQRQEAHFAPPIVDRHRQYRHTGAAGNPPVAAFPFGRSVACAFRRNAEKQLLTAAEGGHGFVHYAAGAFPIQRHHARPAQKRCQAGYGKQAFLAEDAHFQIQSQQGRQHIQPVEIRRVRHGHHHAFGHIRHAAGYAPAQQPE